MARQVLRPHPQVLNELQNVDMDLRANLHHTSDALTRTANCAVRRREREFRKPTHTGQNSRVVPRSACGEFQFQTLLRAPWSMVTACTTLQY